MARNASKTSVCMTVNRCLRSYGRVRPTDNPLLRYNGVGVN